MSMWGPEHQGLTHLEIFRDDWPPIASNTADNYASFPVTISSVMGIAVQNGRVPIAGAEKSVFIWVNRQSRDPVTGAGLKTNALRPTLWHSSGFECRLEYSTVARANAQTLINVMYACGAPVSECEAVAAAAGISQVVTYQYASANREALFTAPPDLGATPPYTLHTYRVARDLVVLPDARFIDGIGPNWGIVLDYEAQDNRSEAETTQLFDAIRAACTAAGLKLCFYTNALDSAACRASGLGKANLPHIHAQADLTSILLAGMYSTPSVYASYKSQIAMLRGPDGDLPVDPSRLCITVGTAGTMTQAMDAAHVIRRLLTDASEIRTLWVWPDWGVPGGGTGEQLDRQMGVMAFGLGMPAPLGRRG